jgi:hypothetical protein
VCGWQELLDEELRDFSSLINTVKVIKSGGGGGRSDIWWEENVTLAGDVKARKDLTIKRMWVITLWDFTLRLWL